MSMRSLAFFLTLQVTTWGIEIPIDLAVEDTSAGNITYSVALRADLFPSAVEREEFVYQGNILATIDYDPASDTVNSISFTGGEIELPDFSMTLVFDGNPFNGVTTDQYRVNFTSSNVVRSPVSSAVDPLAGAGIDKSLHEVTTTGSMTSLANSVPLQTQIGGAIYDLDSQPFFLTSSFLFDQSSASPMTFTSEVVSSELLMKTVKLQLNSFASSFTVENVPTPDVPPYTIYGISLGLIPGLLLQTYSEVGKIDASTTIEMPTAYGQWAEDQDLDLVTGEEVNASGISYRILYALNLPTTTSILPIAATQAPNPQVSIELPSGGLQIGLVPEYSPSLLEDSWDDLPVENFLDGENSLDVGQSGMRMFSLPSGDRQFLRFRLAE